VLGAANGRQEKRWKREEWRYGHEKEGDDIRRKGNGSLSLL
jgi:hypothetical protein